MEVIKPEALGLRIAPDFLAMADSHLVPQGVEIPAPEIIFEIQGIPMLTKKSLSLLIAKAKAGKTTVAAWIIAQAIKQDIKVLWIDTEQGLYYGSRTQHWILSIAGLQQSANLSFYDLKIHAPDIRIQIIDALIQSGDFDLVVIDGIRDLVFDINSPEEATNTATQLMRWAEIHDCHVLTILHQNKGNEHARGHLGAELTNKAETVVKVSQNDAKQVVVEPEFTRGKPFEVFALERDENGKPNLIENWIFSTETGTEGRAKPVTPPYEVDPSVHQSLAKDTFEVESEMTHSKLVIAAKGNISRWMSRDIGVGKTKEYINHWMQFKHIKMTGTPGTKSAKYSINTETTN